MKRLSVIFIVLILISLVVPSVLASEYLEAEQEARKQKVGLWMQANPVPPWEFRKLYR